MPIQYNPGNEHNPDRFFGQPIYFKVEKQLSYEFFYSPHSYQQVKVNKVTKVVPPLEGVSAPPLQFHQVQAPYPFRFLFEIDKKRDYFTVKCLPRQNCGFEELAFALKNNSTLERIDLVSDNPRTKLKTEKDPCILLSSIKNHPS